MDKSYLRKLLKMAVAAPMAFNIALVLDINPSFSFLGSLMMFATIFLMPDPIGLKQV